MEARPAPEEVLHLPVMFTRLVLIFYVARRSIVIKTCFSINRRYDCKHKLVVALFTREECFPIAFETEEELTRWFITLLQIQLADRLAEGDELKPIYGEHWHSEPRKTSQRIFGR